MESHVLNVKGEREGGGCPRLFETLEITHDLTPTVHIWESLKLCSCYCELTQGPFSPCVCVAL